MLQLLANFNKEYKHNAVAACNAGVYHLRSHVLVVRASLQQRQQDDILVVESIDSAGELRFIADCSENVINYWRNRR
jgi:hypothetical protein